MTPYRKCIAPMKPYVPGRPIETVKRMYGLDKVIKLASNENPAGCSPLVAEAVTRTFSDTGLYPDGYCTNLRAALAKKHNISQEQLVFGAGTDEIIAMLGKIFIEPGDECITAAVTFSQYAASAVSMGGVMVYAPMKNNGYDLDAILRLITNKTRLVFIANPNNPTGTYFGADEQARFMAAVPEDVTVVFDEAYQEYVTASDYPNTWETLKNYPNAVLLKTFSKIYGLASLRVGFGAAGPETVSQMEKIRCPFNVSVQAQAAAEAALGDEGYIRASFESNNRNMEKTKKTLDSMGLDYIDSQTNFLMVKVERPDMEMFEALMAKGYIVRSGTALGLPGYLRVSIGTEEQMDGFLSALREVL